jgi:hypothetical protein
MGGSKIGLNAEYNNLNHPFKHTSHSGRSQALPTAGEKNPLSYGHTQSEHKKKKSIHESNI